MKKLFLVSSCAVLAAISACGGDDTSAPPRADAGVISLGDGGVVGIDAPADGPPLEDATVEAPDASGRPARDGFVTGVVSFAPGPCGGFGAGAMPGVVFGPPEGTGDLQGSFDVVSLGVGGEIVVSFAPSVIVDGPGPDFIVFENAFFANGDPSAPAADLGEVSVSEDGVTWKTFTCAPGAAPPYAPCAGWTPVRSSSTNGVSPTDVAAAGGEAFDLADVGLARARYVRIRDLGRSSCPGAGPRPSNLGFDLDAIALLNRAQP